MPCRKAHMPSCTSALLYKIWEHWNEIFTRVWNEAPVKLVMKLWSELDVNFRKRERVHREIWDPAVNLRQGLLNTSRMLLPLSHWTHGGGAEASLAYSSRSGASARNLRVTGPTAEKWNYSVSQHIATRQQAPADFSCHTVRYLVCIQSCFCSSARGSVGSVVRTSD